MSRSAYDGGRTGQAPFELLVEQLVTDLKVQQTDQAALEKDFVVHAPAYATSKGIAIRHGVRGRRAASGPRAGGHHTLVRRALQP
jgi:hypothetical protein